MQEKINPFDILSGKVVQNDCGTFYFKESGNSNWNLTTWQGGLAPNRSVINAKMQRNLNCTLIEKMDLLLYTKTALRNIGVMAVVWHK